MLNKKVICIAYFLFLFQCNRSSGNFIDGRLELSLSRRFCCVTVALVALLLSCDAGFPDETNELVSSLSSCSDQISSDVECITRLKDVLQNTKAQIQKVLFNYSIPNSLDFQPVCSDLIVFIFILVRFSAFRASGNI